MFFGTLPDNARKVISKYIPYFCEEINVICSGNFTIESTLRRNGYNGIINSSDVSLYSCSLGWFLTDQDFALKINKEDWLEKYIDSPINKTATVLLMADSSRIYPRKNDYQKSRWNEFVKGWPILHDKMVKKITDFKSNVSINTFEPKDLHQKINDKCNGIVTGFMPTIFKGYEKLYSVLDEVFEWKKPPYELFDNTEQFYKNFINKTRKWIIFSQHEISEIYNKFPDYVSVVEKNNKVNIYIYTNITTSNMYVRRKINTCPIDYMPIYEHEIKEDSNIELCAIDSPKFNYLREIYTAKNIKLTGSVQDRLIVLIDGHLAGLIGFTLGKYQIDEIYVLCDIAFPSRFHNRLSKLIVMISLTHEVKERLDKKYINNFKSLLTTAFTNKPVSMKYRGILKLKNRKPGMLNYVGQLGQYSLREALQKWLKKYN